MIPAFVSDLGISSANVGVVIASDIRLGPSQPFSASRLCGMGQILPHPSLIHAGEIRPPVMQNAGYDPFPRELRSMENENDQERAYGDFFPNSPDVTRAWFVMRIM